VLGDAAAPALVEALATRGQGNPFFLEELAWALADGGAPGPATVPATVRDALAARMDRLPPTPRRVLDTACVLGREAPLPLLEALLPAGGDLGPTLRDLVAREFLYEAPGRVLFKHALTQDVAYQRLDAEARRELHGAAGHAYEQLWADRLDEVLDRLAHHFTRAGERERAVAYLTRLGERLTAGYTLAEARAVLLQGLDEARRLPGEHGDRAVLDILERLTMILLFLGRLAESVELLERAGPRFTRHPASPLARRYQAWLAGAAVHVGRYDVVEASARLAVDASASLGDDVTLAVAYWALATRSFFVGCHADGETQGQRAVDSLAPRRPTAWHERYWLSHGHWMLGWNAVVCGELARADIAGAETARIGAAMEDPRIQSYGLSERAWSLALQGDLPSARGLAERARGLAPDPLCRAVVATLFGCVMCEAGDPASALAAVQPARDQFQAFGMRSMAAWNAAVLAEAALALGRLDEVEAWAATAASEGAEAGFPYVRALGQRLRGRAAHAAGKLEEASTRLREALDDFAGISARYEAARTRLDLARVCHARGERAAAVAQLAEAHVAFAQLGVPCWIERTAQLGREWGLGLAGPVSQAQAAPSSRDG
jgi:tetratricopeptide (TPR) repeat protein